MKLLFSPFLLFSLATQASAVPSDKQEFETNQRKLATSYGTNFFVDSKDTEYNAYQTAWRYLGHIVKCGYPSNRYDESNDSKSHDSREGYTMGNNYCQRFLLWAAYVDPSYSGGGIGEYMVYDTDNEGYDYTACQTNGNGRCVEMDCHDSNTETWKLMGVYKEAVWYGGDAFFEQLFKHEAYCIWNDDDIYEFMSDAREKWTAGCIDTGYTDEWNNAMYIDLKPGYNGNMQYSLYKDYVCREEYNGSYLDVDTVATNIGLLSNNYLNKWNAYMEPFKVCQPCKAYNLQAGRRELERDLYDNNYQWGGNANYNNYNGNNNNNNYNSNSYSNYYNDDNKGHFQCNDDAGYTNVNQCMKLRSHADLEIATWEDLVIGTEQGGIMEIKIGETYFGTKKMTTNQAQYMQSLMKEKAQAIQDKEDEYKHMLEKLPSSTLALIFGFLLMSMGMTALAGSIYLTLKKLNRMEGGASMDEPLILKKLGIRSKRLKSYINFKRKERKERNVGVV